VVRAQGAGPVVIPDMKADQQLMVHLAQGILGKEAFGMTDRGLEITAL
jgi:hypothetical protein